MEDTNKNHVKKERYQKSLNSLFQGCSIVPKHLVYKTIIIKYIIEIYVNGDTYAELHAEMYSEMCV